MMSTYPTILSRNLSDSLEKFFSVLSDQQAEYVKQKYKDYMFAAVGRPREEADIFAEVSKENALNGIGRVDSSGAFVSCHTCFNMQNGDCEDIEGCYSYALRRALGSSSHPFMKGSNGFFVTPSYSNPVRLAWIMAVLRVSFSKQATEQLLTFVLDRSEYDRLGCVGLCIRLSGIEAGVEIREAFSTCGLNSSYPFGKYAYLQMAEGNLSGMYDPRRMSFLLGCIILGCWQNGIESPIPGSSLWQDILQVAYDGEGGLTDKEKQKYFSLVFGIEDYEGIPEMVYEPVMRSDEVSRRGAKLSRLVIPLILLVASVANAAAILCGLYSANCIASTIGSSGAH